MVCAFIPSHDYGRNWVVRAWINQLRHYLEEIAVIYYCVCPFSPPRRLVTFF